MKLNRIHHLLGRAREFFAQLLVLGAHPNRARIRMALSDHDAAHCDQRCCADSELLCTEQGGYHHIPARAQPAIDTKDDTVAELIESQDLMDLRQPQLPGQSGILDRRLWTGARSLPNGLTPGSYPPGLLRRLRR